jgi:hypothetical protein
MRSRIVPLVVLACATCALSGFRSARADTFYVDPDFSSLSIAIYDHSTSTLLTSAQTSGSDTTTLGGTFDATIASGAITFNSGAISFDNQGTDMQPAIGGGGDSAGTAMNPYPPSPGSDPASYGLVLSVYDPDNPESLVLAGVLAVRDALAGISSDSAITITGGSSFDASQINMVFNSGTTLDYNINNGSDGSAFLNGTTAIDGTPGANTLTGGGIGTFGGVTGITIPVYVDVNVTTGGLNVDVVLSGSIGATNAAPGAPVPEPGTFVLAAMALVGGLPVAVRRMRKSR